jgi:hypothetical protein
MVYTACPVIIASYAIGQCKNMAFKAGMIVYLNWLARLP